MKIPHRKQKYRYTEGLGVLPQQDESWAAYNIRVPHQQEGGDWDQERKMVTPTSAASLAPNNEQDGKLEHHRSYPPL